MTTGKRWRLTITEDCIGSGLCFGNSAEYFQMVDGFSQPVHDVVDPSFELYDIAYQCPMEAILLTDAETGVPLLPPPGTARDFGPDRT